MKRLILLMLAVAAFAPSTAGAAAPCRVKIYNDWYRDGKIATSYPLACYRDALKNVPTDAKEYSSLGDDIRSAMQGALARKAGQTKVPAEVGTGGPPRHESSSKPKPNQPPHDAVPDDQPVGSTLPTSTVAVGATASSGSSVPVPLLVLGGLALALTAVGGIGVIAKRRRT